MKFKNYIWLLPIIVSIIIIIINKNIKEQIKENYLNNQKEKLNEKLNEIEKDTLQKIDYYNSEIEYYKSNKEKIENNYCKLLYRNQELNDSINSLNNTKNYLQQEISNLKEKQKIIEEKEKELVTNNINAFKDKQTEELKHEKELQLSKINSEVELYKIDSIRIIKEEIKKQNELLQSDYEAKKSNFQSYINELIEKIEKTQNELTEYQLKRDALNKEIMRRRELEEKQDFYRIMLDEASIHDLALIDTIRCQFSKVDILNKLLYDNYIKKSVDEMIKRVLNGRSPSGIYKITRLKTGEIYIGKSTDVSARWSQHTKSVYHCGTISHSTLHTTMEKDGITNFTWELLEEVPKDKLTEREKYWIEFYDSKKYGLNEKAGG